VRVVLIGFMGAGKTTVAKQLSELSSLPWLEMDALVLEKTGAKNMGEVFAMGGELLLRETEIAIAKEWGDREYPIISTGGGVVHNQIIVDYFKAGGAKIVFLHAPFEEIAKRLESDRTRPLFSDLRGAKKLYDLRLPLYLHSADLVVEAAGRAPDEIARIIIGK